MVLLGRMLVVVLACMAFGRPATGLAQSVKDTAELAQQVLDEFDFETQTSFEDEQAIRALAEQGDANAQHELGVLLAVGKGAERDYIEAAQWLQRAAKQGHAGAQFWIGNLYRRGAGVTRNIAKMVEWWRKAARQGNISAQYALGAVYRDGRMVKRDVKRAKAWFHMAGGGPAAIDPVQKPKQPKKVAVVQKAMEPRGVEDFENPMELDEPALSPAEIEAAEREARLAAIRARRRELYTKEDAQAGR